MDNTAFDITRLKARLEKLLPLENIVPLCPGFARADQVFLVGDDVICRDRVLVEETTYPVADDLNAEMNSLPIKMGMLSPFLRSTTPPPKYYYTDRATAWLVTAVPRVSLADVLEAIHERYPPHYTWDRPRWVRDVLLAIAAAAKTAWNARRNPLKAVRDGRAMLHARMPQRITPDERLQFAALLVDAVWAKHAAGIHHDNICPHTVFFPDALSPRLLGNYAGLMPPVMEQSVPQRVRAREDTFGEQSVDTYALALLVYEIVTGRPLNGASFQLDPPLPVHVPALFERRLPSRLGFANGAIDVLHEAFMAGARFWARLRTTFDQSVLVNFRALTRASGSIMRSIPGLRCVLDVWFPTEIALVLRAILDAETNRRLFGATTKVNRHLRVKRNANLAFLRAALPPVRLARSSVIVRLVQGIIERSQERGETVEDDERENRRMGLHLGRAVVARYALTGTLLLMLCASVSNHDTSLAARKAPVASATDAARSSGCTAKLLPNRKYPGVYKVTGMRRRCRTADLVFTAGDEFGVAPPVSLGETYVQMFIARKTRDGYAAAVVARPCPSQSRGCEQGDFYRVSGLYGLGERVRLAEEDVIAFDEARLQEFLAAQR